MSGAADGRITLRQFWTDLPREGRWLLSTVTLHLIGRGLTLPFTVIYLAEVRGFSLATAGAVMAFMAVVAAALTGAAGALIDALGARAVIIGGTVVQIAGVVTLAFATTPAAAFLAAALMGVNYAAGWPAINAFIAAIVTGPMRQQYFGVNFALINLGIGIGGIVSGLYVDVERAETFTTIFLLDAASLLIPLALMLGPLRHVHARAPRPEPDREASAQTGPGSAYLLILRRPAMLWLTVITFLTTFVGYGQMEAGFPAFARQGSQVSTAVIGYAFAVNTATIVLLQFAVLRLIQGHRRTRVLIGLCLLWSIAWAILGATALVPATLSAAIGVLLFHLAFGLGETMLHPTIPATVNDLAPDHLRGRYNAANSLAFHLGAIVAPVVAGLMLGAQLTLTFIAFLLIVLGIVAALTRVLERHLTPEQNGVLGHVGAPPG
ncbi:MAG: MFS transporter [Dermatophilaceae bacterium]